MIEAGLRRYEEVDDEIKKELSKKNKVTVKDVNGQRYIGCALDKGKTIEVYGTPGNDMACYLNGGRTPTAHTLFDWAREGYNRGAGEILFTSMNHDGTKEGFANEALCKISESVGIPLIASGGAGKKEDFRDAFVKGRADAALAASVFHYGEIKIPELKQYLQKENIDVRLQ